MSINRLSFVEGMPGAGKSTTAVRIAEWIEASGHPVLRFHEMDDDNPIRTRGVDAMRFGHPHAGRMPDVGADGFARDPAVYALAQWGELARRTASGDTAIVLESRYMQNSVQPRYVAGAPRAKVLEGFDRIHAELAFARPLLVYLRPTDVAAHLDATFAARDPAWGRWILESYAGFGWAKARGLSGMDAVRGFYADWEELAAQLFDRHSGPKIRIDDPQTDWPGSLERIFSALDSD